MHSTTKGALAAGAATVLLLGGAGTLAFWTAEGNVPGGSIKAGSLKLVPGDCDQNWSYADGAAGDGAPVSLFVPGDIITKTCTFTIDASGDNLSASVNVPENVAFGEVEDADTLTIDTDATFSVSDGTTARDLDDTSIITSADNESVLTAVLVATIDYGNADTINANDTQDITATLDDLAVTLTQVNPNAAP